MNVTTFLWFEDGAEAAADHYTAVFSDSDILDTQRDADNHVTSVTFRLAGQLFTAYNGGTALPFTSAISLYVGCDAQDEIDALWEGLADGGTEGAGGSLTDRFGITWQILPVALQELLDPRDGRAAQRVLTALHAMTKIDIRVLTDVRDGAS